MASSEHSSLKSIFLALGANFFIAVAKTIAAVITGSGAMLAEAIHSGADCGNQLLLLFGIKNAEKPADETHPLGYGKAIYFWSFIVALMLFSVGGMFSVYEGVHKLNSKEPINNPQLAIGILAFSLVLELIALGGVIKQINKLKGDLSLVRWFKSSRKSELIVILGEDSAAVGGLLFALGAVIMSMVTGNLVYDAIGSIAIGLILIVVASLVAVEIKSLIVGESADEGLRKQIQSIILENDNVNKIFSMRTLQLGTDIMLAVKVHMQKNISAKELILSINATEKQLKQEIPEIRWIFFEPDLTDID